MTDTSNPRHLASIALARIEQAFAARPRPLVLTDSMQLSDAEYEEVMAFEGMCWRDVAFSQVECCADAVFWFSPEAFCYYLPGFLMAGLEVSRTDSNAYDAVVHMLDRSPEPAYWDAFFEPRWTGFSIDELAAIRAWLAWLEAVEPAAVMTNTYARAHATLTLLEAHSGERA